MQKKNKNNKNSSGFTPTPFIKKGVSLQSKRGFMMVEVIVVISIIVVSVLAAMSVTEKSIYVSRQALRIEQASFLLEEGAESVRIIRDNAWSNISLLNAGTDYYLTFSAGTWSLSTTPSTIGIFTRKINVSNVNRNTSTDDIASSGADDPETKLITIAVSWTDGGDTINKTLSFYIMDIFS